MLAAITEIQIFKYTKVKVVLYYANMKYLSMLIINALFFQVDIRIGEPYLIVCAEEVCTTFDKFYHRIF